MKIAKVFIDTNILKFSATELPRLAPRKQSLNWGGNNIEVTVHDSVEINRNDLIKNNDALKAETELLRPLAEIGKQGALNYVMNVETELESWGIPNMDSRGGRFYGAPIQIVEAPFKYERTVASSASGSDNLQFDFLRSLAHPRFTELQKMTGAYQGERGPNKNQLIDAFHLWCAEHNKCDFFLTLDLKLIKVLSLLPSKTTVQVVPPSKLLLWTSNELSKSNPGK